jgi:ParB family chromosome partitioning protein
MTDPILHIPLDQIDEAALPRDRTRTDPARFEELWSSISRSGLRQPIEVFENANPRAPARYALISGHRRFLAFQFLHRQTGAPAFAAIPAFVRAPADIAEALRAMVEENDIRAELSPWEKARVAIATRDQGHFPTTDAALDALYPSAARQKRAKLRTIATLAEELGPALTAPERLSENQLLRLAAALRDGFTDLIHHILAEVRGQDMESQWSALLPTIQEAERAEPDIPATATSPARPRRLLSLKQGLVIRREMTATGWVLRFSGPEARRRGLMDDVMDEVERMFQRG